MLEIDFICILEITFKPLVNSNIPVIIPDEKSFSLNRGSMNFSKMVIKPVCLKIEIITEKSTTKPPTMKIVFTLFKILEDKASPKVAKEIELHFLVLKL